MKIFTTTPTKGDFDMNKWIFLVRLYLRTAPNSQVTYSQSVLIKQQWCWGIHFHQNNSCCTVTCLALSKLQQDALLKFSTKDLHLIMLSYAIGGNISHLDGAFIASEFGVTYLNRFDAAQFIFYFFYAYVNNVMLCIFCHSSKSCNLPRRLTQYFLLSFNQKIQHLCLLLQFRTTAVECIIIEWRNFIYWATSFLFRWIVSSSLQPNTWLLFCFYIE